ncbi:hypothetical protein MMYC01_200189 [Madurella mycetomatis]|uniref:F-box domain-containing protein n=1 Tax=Madurella mycetomatis TaxID=100816 RepID=A0A175VYK3_9PEZI|nr:hypothetical protein MMYC01_206815 [Madurella mycetomatis]KXX83240.1 hypothetical protein MMYC01_200189 [Madurella mycetomatis]
MAAGFFARSGPPELILCILQCCESTHDLLSLTSTCRHIHNIWQTHAAAVLWGFWLKQIPCFEDALTAARLTQRVVDAERRGELTPLDLTPHALNGSPMIPTIPELKAALALSDLAATQEVVFYVQHTVLPHYQDPPDTGTALPEEPSRMLEWSRHVRKAIYRTFIAGAALSGAYTEPLFKASPELGLELVRKGSRPSGSQLRFLEQFAVCNMAATPEAEEAVFEPFGAWLLENILSDKQARQAMADRFRSGCGRARRCRNLGSCPVSLVGGGSHSDAHLVVWEVMKMVWAFDHTGDAKYAIAHAAAIPDLSPPSSPVPSGGQAGEIRQSASRTALVALFGVFRPEEVHLPKRLAISWWSAQSELQAHLDASKKTAPRSRYISTRGSAINFSSWIYSHSGQPNCIRGTTDPVAPLTFKFFEYFLRRYLRLRFLPNSFHFITHDGQIFNEFVSSLSLFALDDGEDRKACCSGPDVTVEDLSTADFLDGSEILTSFDPPPELEFVRMF